jgi:fatty-acyl-CoA synthase
MTYRKFGRFFNSGDLLSRDNYGFFYWSDRVGDTFRWKGENVATTEVEAVVGAVPGIEDVAVYGVEIPNCDGKVGMASVKLQEGLTLDRMDWSKFHSECAAHLPVYSRPAFVRIRSKMTVTSTFKHQKNDLVKEGYNPSLMNGDHLFYYSVKEGAYLRLEAKAYADICAGVIKL